MGFFRRIAGLLGFAKDDVHESKGESEDDPDDQTPTRPPFKQTGVPRKGFGVQVQVPVDRPQIGPLITSSTSGDGGVQGLRWYAKRLRIDEDGDVADEFLDEVPPKIVTRFKVKNGTRPAKVKRQALLDGKLQQCVEHQGRLQWV
ncbi:phospholipid hydroperoxide glutathione peroxidase [Senna tora]|uniref:Phospholipid hydroperoxide glutathione peroxidase n=1 Tax=Senna tora TaxID=362788 RepID=A0A834WS35_9FABA|nr:phospholipid hydroperoxide glutathione peroxidase [Senna tora]